MQAVRTPARLVDSAPFDVGAHGITATLPTSEIDEVLQAEEEPIELWLDVAILGEKDDERAIVDARTVMLPWERGDLRTLLEKATGDQVALVLNADELAQALALPDVDAHGLRERALVIAVAATTAAGAFGVSQAVGSIPWQPTGGTGSAAVATGPAAPGQQSPPEAGGGAPIVVPAPPATEPASSSFPGGVLGIAGTAGGVALLITAAGFAVRGQRRAPRPT